MDDGIDFLITGRFKSSVIVGEKVFASSSPMDTGLERIIESEMCVGQKQ
jgi:hypothetical protein